MNILLVEDHHIVREGVRRILVDAFPSVHIGEASSAIEAMARLTDVVWDVVLLDLSLPGRSGLDVLKDIRLAYPRLPVLIMTMHAEDQYALRAFRGGASGYITKGSGAQDLLIALNKVLAGGRYVSADVAEQLVNTLGSLDRRPPHEQLSDRELQVMVRLASGRSVKEIGHELGLSHKTISTYRARLMAKMHLRTGAELVRYALRAGLVDA